MTIYIPERHAEADRGYIHAFLDTYPFAMAITTAGGLRVTNVPTLLTPPDSGEEWGTLHWHIARSNPQNVPLGEGAETTLIFQSPHSYISPNWYETPLSVPTWNFAVVHCSGRPAPIADDAVLTAMLERLTAVNEAKYGGGNRWELGKLPEAYLAGLRRAITGYEMKIERVEAKFKLGQERSAADRMGVLEALHADRGAEKPLAQLTEEYYRRRSGPAV